jgi:hypothetical protein
MKTCLLALVALLSGCTSIETKIEINAPASAVRAVLFNYDQYPQWNPYIVKVDGPVTEGGQLYLTIHVAGRSEITGYAKVLVATDNQVTWRGTGLSQVASGPVTLPIPGILSAKHDFIIQEVGPGKTLVINNDRFSGADIPFQNFGPMEDGLNAMNEALKKRVEQGAPKASP